jgi:DegV family protein with EDD domain
MSGVRVLTDSTACLPPNDATADLSVVPLTVVTPSGPRREGVDIDSGEVAELLAGGNKLTTSQPSRGDFESAYQGALDDGADAIVAVLLSGDLSGTCASASATAEATHAPVTVVDSRTSAMALGFAAQAAAECAAAGGSAEQVAERARQVAAHSQVRIIVDTLDDLKRGGRLSAGRASFGGALGIRPVLAMKDGKLEITGRARTRAAAWDKLLTLSVADILAAKRPAIAVHYVGNRDRADELAQELFERTAVRPVVTPLSAVLAAHTGPDTIAVAVADLGE